MYAIIRAGGKQAKVHSGDVIDIERVKGDAEELTFEPLLVVDDDGKAVSDHSALAKASVVAKVLGESQGPKIDIFKYKNKTGYRRRQGHRQKYTRIEITEINLPKKASPKKAEGTKAASAKDADASAAPTKKPVTKKPVTKKPATKKPATKPTAAKDADATAAPAKKPATKKPATKPSAAKSKKPAASEEE